MGIAICSARNDNKKAGNDNKKGRNDTHSVTLSGLAKGLAMRAKKGQNDRESCHCEDRSKPAPAKAGEAISWGLPYVRLTMMPLCHPER